MKVLAIHPGNVESAYALIDSKNYEPLEIDKIENNLLLEKIDYLYDKRNINNNLMDVVIEIGSDKNTLETVFWIGRFYERSLQNILVDEEGNKYEKVNRIYHKDIKMNLCGKTKANNSTITQALIDRFAYNVPNLGKGYKSTPGFFYGFRDDIWKSYAVGVTYIDNMKGGE